MDAEKGHSDPIERNRRRRQRWALFMLAVADALLWAVLG